MEGTDMQQATRNRSDSKTKTCTEDGCDKPLRALGRCVTHYNAHRYGADRPRHPTRAMNCGQCGVVIHKQPNTALAVRYCSTLCRTYARFGSMSCPVPLKHISRQAFCPVPRDHPSRLTQRAHDRSCEWCGHNAGGLAYCDINCRRRAKRARRRGREADGHTYSWTHVMQVYALLGYRCAYCRQPVEGLPEPDHVIPLSRGGSNGNANILPACPPCNADKRDLLLWEWDIDRTARNKPTVRTQIDRADPAFAHLLPDSVASSVAA